MGNSPPDSTLQLDELIARLDAAQREFRSLTADQVDAEVLPDDLPLLLSGAQEALQSHVRQQCAHADQRAAILDALPVMAVLLDADGGIIASNAAWRRAEGSAPVATTGVGGNYLEVCDQAEGDGAEYAAAIAAGIREVLAGKRIEFSMDYPCATREEPGGWYRLLAAPLPGAGRPGAVVVHIDITAEHHATTRARREERYFRQLFDANPMPMWLYDTQSLKFLDVNRAAIEHYGYGREQFLGMTIQDILPAEDRECLAQFLAGPDRHSRKPTQWRHVRADSSVIDVEIFADDFDGEGRSGRLIAAVDVTKDMRNRRAKDAEARVLSAISTRAPLDRILHLIVSGIEEVVTFSVASILLLTPDGKRMQHGAAPSLPERFTSAIDGLEIGPQVGSCGTAMHRDETVVVDDIRTDPLWRDFVDLADEMELRACWSLPVHDSAQRVIGSLALYCHETHTPEPWEHELIERFGSLTGLAVGRQRQDEALETSERRLKKLFRDAATGIVVVTEQGDFEQANGVFAEIGGWPESRIPELNYHDITHPDDRENVGAAMRRLLSGESSVETVEQRFMTAESGQAWGRVRLSAQSGKSGRPARLIGIIEDITLRKKTELHLERARALQRIAGRIGRVGGWSVDLGKDEVIWSPEIFEILDWDADEPPPLSQSLDLYPPEHRANLLAALKRCSESGTPFDIEAEIVTRKHQRVQVRAAGEAETGPDGEVRRVIGVFQDITAQKKMEAQRAELAIRLENVLNNMSDAFMLLDDAWTINYINRAGERMVGARGSELLGRNLWEAFPEARETVVHEQYMHAKETGESVHFDLYYKPLENWFEINAYPSEEGLAVYFSQTTEKRELQEQLQQAQRLESVGQLTGGIAHDFNNLLTVILGNAELLSESLEGSDELEPVARMIGDAALRGAELTRRLLAFARRQPLEPKAVDVNGLIGDMEDLLRRSLGEQCEIEVVRGAGQWTAMIDPVQFESALMNLAINARDAMPDGGRMTIETANVNFDEDYKQTHPEVAVGQYVMVAVSDTGTGIAADIIGKVFEPFVTTKEKGRGTGLGLSMVYGFIKQSAGHIEIFSEVGEGTTVRLYLPRTQSEIKVCHTSELPTDVGGSEMILVVEDDPAVLKHAANVLSALGYRVQTASNGSEALALLQQPLECDLLFTDVVMPGSMSGRELADKALQLRPGLKVLFTSGYTENAIVHDGRLDSGVQLLSKPYRRDELAQRVRRMLDRDS